MLWSQHDHDWQCITMARGLHTWPNLDLGCYQDSIPLKLCTVLTLRLLHHLQSWQTYNLIVVYLRRLCTRQGKLMADITDSQRILHCDLWPCGGKPSIMSVLWQQNHKNKQCTCPVMWTSPVSACLEQHLPLIAYEQRTASGASLTNSNPKMDSHWYLLKGLLFLQNLCPKGDKLYFLFLSELNIYIFLFLKTIWP